MRKGSTGGLLPAEGINVLKKTEPVGHAHGRLMQTSGIHRLKEEFVKEESAAYFSLSNAGEIVDFNRAAIDLLGLDPKQLKSISLVDFIAKGSKQIFTGFISDIFLNGGRQTCKVVLSVDGKLPFQVSLTGYSTNKAQKCVIKMCCTSPLHSVPGNVCEECGHRFAQLHKLNEGKDKLFSIIAHDLRSPFNGLLGLTEIMAEGLQDMSMAQIGQMASIIRSSASKIYNLLDNLLEWSLMQRGLTPFTPSTIVLAEKIEECRILLAEMTHNKEITVSNEVPEDLEIFADPHMIGSILRNLFTNAIKFTPRGGAITFSAKQTYNNHVEIGIQDSGIGMDKEMIENLFQPGIAVNRKGTEDEPSTGFGLMICKDFIEKHSGKLWIESEPGKGSVFYFTIPAGGKATESNLI